MRTRYKYKTHDEMLKMCLELAVMFNLDEFDFRGRKITQQEARKLLEEMEKNV